jgi:uncharacterized protein YprB with RNaseH-like and TPR domain
MAGNLKSRLSRIRAAQAGGAAKPREEETRTSREAPSFLAGWERMDEFVYRREIRFDLELPEVVDAAPFLGRSAALELRDPGAAIAAETGSLRFFDLETTGLSGGTGTLAFLAAIGRPSEGGLSVTQVFLADYPGEPLFISAMLEALGADATLVTYNGKSFDLPLLRTRCVMNGLAPPLEARHLDLLHVSRRLWRSVHGGASLGLLEEAVLGKDRGPDVPGSLIPALWFAYLSRGEEGRMDLVMSHNASDVATLASLLALESAIFASPLDHAGDGGLDRAALGRCLLALGRAGEGEALLEAAARDGNERAAILLSRRYGRSGRAEDRARIQELLGSGFDGMVERAKFLEHCGRDYREALAWVRRAERSPEAGTRAAELAARKERLIRKEKLARAKRGGE